MKMKYLPLALFGSLILLTLLAACPEPGIPTLPSDRAISSPSTPANLMVLSTTDTTVFLCWSDGSGTVKYQVSVSTALDGTYTPYDVFYGALTISSNLFGAFVTRLNPNTTYYFKMSGINSGGSSPYCAPVAGTTAAANTWANLAVTGVSDISVGLSFNVLPGARTYSLVQSSTINGVYTASMLYGFALSGNTISTTVTSLNPGTTYYIKVIALDGMNHGPSSPPIVATTAATGATPVQGRDAFLQDYNNGMAALNAAMSANPLVTAGTRTYQVSGAKGGNVALQLTKTVNSITSATIMTEKLTWSNYWGPNGTIINGSFSISDTGLGGTLTFDYQLKPGTVAFMGTNNGGIISGTYTINFAGSSFIYDYASGLPTSPASTGATPQQGRDAFLQDYSDGMAALMAAISTNPLVTAGTKTYQASGSNGGNVILKLTKTVNANTLTSTTTEVFTWSGYWGTHGAIINNSFTMNNTGVSGTLSFVYGLKSGSVAFSGTNNAGSFSGTYTINFAGSNFTYDFATGLPK